MELIDFFAKLSVSKTLGGRQRRFDLAFLLPSRVSQHGSNFTPPRSLHCFQTCGHKSTYITKLNTTQLVICRGSSTAYAQPLIVEMNSQNHIFFQIKSNQNCLGCIFLRIYTLNGQYCLSAPPLPHTPIGPNLPWG